MGTKSTNMQKNLRAEMEAINTEFTKCEGQLGYFRDRLEEFLDAPLSSDKRKDLYGQMKSVSLQLLPLAEKVLSLIRPSATAPSLLDIFDRFLSKKKKAHEKDWTSVKKKTLQKNLDFVENTKTELETIRGICNPIQQYVTDVLAHCRQG
jgi:hypothetical protein